MPILSNPRHERFAQELAAGKSATDAYAAAGYMPDRKNAARLTTNDGIVTRVAELQGRVAEGVVLTRQYVLERLMQNLDRAMQEEEVYRDGKPTGEFQYRGNVANKALELLGKEIGMFVERKEIKRVDEFERMNADELREHIRREAEALGISAVPASHANGSGKPH